MNKFIKPPIETIDGRYDWHTNLPINLNNCKAIKKDTYSTYPDNTGVPCIVFKGNDEKWLFTYEEERDEEFNKISENNFNEGEE